MDIEALVRAQLEKRFFTADDIARAIRAALTEQASWYEERLNKIQSNDLMAECMEQTRSDLIASGVIDKTCAPMFLADAVISRVRNLEQKDYTGGDAELLRERIRQLEAELAEGREQADGRLDAIDKLQPLARRALWMAFVWNDHNFTHPLDYAREEAKKAGLNSREDAKKFLSDVAMLAAAPQPKKEN